MLVKPRQTLRHFMVGLTLVGLLAGPPGFGRNVLGQSAVIPAAPRRDAAPPVTHLTVVATAQVKDGESGQGTSAVGPLDPAATPQAEQTFLLKNENAQPVTIARLRASCGCESLLLLRRGVPAASVTLAPGEEVGVRMAVKLAGQHGGPLHKYAWVYGPKGDMPLASLEMVLTLRSPVSCSPELVNFGSGPAGLSRSLRVTVTADRSALAGAAFPPLISDSPDVQVTAVGEPVEAARDGQSSLAQKYQVVLQAQAPAGHVQSHLKFSASSASGPSAAAPAFAAVSLGVVGEVLGQLSATPKTLFFGSIPAGKEVTRQVILTSPSSGGLTGLRLSGNPLWLAVHLGQPVAVGTGSAFLCPLRVTLSALAPAGAAQEQITLTTDKGDRLVIPVVWETIRQPLAPSGH